MHTENLDGIDVESIDLDEIDESQIIRPLHVPRKQMTFRSPVLANLDKEQERRLYRIKIA